MTGFVAGTAAGAVYNPVVEIVPTVAFPPITPFTCQVTAVLLVFVTVAVNCCVRLMATLTDFGATVTLIPGATNIVTVADPDLVESATETAVIVTAAGLGATAGAVYSPVVEMVPTVAFPPFTPFTCHVTAVFEVFVTVAVNCCVKPVTTVAVLGLTATETGGVIVTVAVSNFVLSA